MVDRIFETTHPIEEAVNFLGASSQPYYDVVSVLVDAAHLPNLMTSFLIQTIVRKPEKPIIRGQIGKAHVFKLLLTL